MAATTRSDLLGWLAGFEAAAAADRDALRARPLDSARSIRLALSLIEEMWQAVGGQPPIDLIREREVEDARRTWLRLAAGWRR
jgi:hypothetical protein